MLNIYGHDGHIGHVTSTVCKYFPSLSPRRLYKKFGYIWPSGFWGDVWDCHTMRVLSQRLNTDLDLFYSQIFMYSLRQLYLLIFRPKSSKLSMKSSVFAFSIFDLAVKKSRSTQGHHLNTLSSTWIPNAKYQVPRPSVHWFGRRWFLRVFTRAREIDKSQSVRQFSKWSAISGRTYGNSRLEVYVRIYVTFEIRKSLFRGYRREFWCIYLYIAASLLTKYLSIFLDVLSAENLFKKKKYFGISANKLMLFSTTSPLQ